MDQYFDIIIVGGGPAGLTAALYAKRAGFSTLLLEGGVLGGQAAATPDIENWPGTRHISGSDFAANLYEQSRALGAELRLEAATALEAEGALRRVSTSAGRYEARCVILANGVKRRKLGVPGEERLAGRGVSYCATCDGMLYRGKPVAVVGYTDTARQEAEFLQKIGCSVTYFDRPKQCEIRGDGRVESVTCDGRTIPAEGVFILRPTMAPTELFPGLAVEQGYVTVDRRMATNLPGLFAAGDCTGGPLQVSKAAGDGLIAGQSAAAWAAAQERREKQS